MQYTFEIWKNRHRHRSDISIYVTHLTRESEKIDPSGILLKILTEKKLIGSTTDKGFIIGNEKAVCFQDAPLYGVAQNSLHEQLNKKELGDKIRYRPVGISFRKDYVYKKGGRPVFYEKKDIAKKLLPENEWWRIVSFDLSDSVIIDWTHEREWRVKGDFSFELNEAIVLLPKTAEYTNFISNTPKEILNELGGIIVMDPVLS